MYVSSEGDYDMNLARNINEDIVSLKNSIHINDDENLKEESERSELRSSDMEWDPNAIAYQDWELIIK